MFGVDIRLVQGVDWRVLRKASHYVRNLTNNNKRKRELPTLGVNIFNLHAKVVQHCTSTQQKNQHVPTPLCSQRAFLAAAAAVAAADMAFSCFSPAHARQSGATWS